jgi:hypothetical protein
MSILGCESQGRDAFSNATWGQLPVNDFNLRMQGSYAQYHGKTIIVTSWSGAGATQGNKIFCVALPENGDTGKAGILVSVNDLGHAEVWGWLTQHAISLSEHGDGIVTFKYNGPVDSSTIRTYFYCDVVTARSRVKVDETLARIKAMLVSNNLNELNEWCGNHLPVSPDSEPVGKAVLNQ